MKKIDVKKIVMCSLGLLSVVMLLAGLAFSAVEIDFGLANDFNAELNKIIDYIDNGYDVLSFKFTAFISETICVAMIEQWVVSFEILFGLMSILCIVTAVIGFILIMIGMFKKSVRGYKTLTDTFIGIAFTLAVVYSVLTLVNSEYVSSILVERYDLEYTISSSMYGMFILETVVLIAYILCDKLIPDKVGKTQNAVHNNCNNSADKIDLSQIIAMVLDEEKKTIALINAYYDLSQVQSITHGEFLEKKVSIFAYNEKNYNRINSIRERMIFGLADFEQKIVDLINEYKELCDKDIITSADYLEKKSKLLHYIII